METIEMVGFLFFTIIVAGLITAFVFQFDFNRIGDNVRNMFMPPSNEPSLTKVNFTKFAARLNYCWQECQFGEVYKDCGNVVLLDESFDGNKIGELDEAKLNNFFRKMNYCTDCRILIENQPIVLPKVLNISCNEKGNHALKIT